MNFKNKAASSSRVEVPGWDTKEGFFVEKAYFDSEDKGGNVITIKTSLREGSVVFLQKF